MPKAPAINGKRDIFLMRFFSLTKTDDPMDAKKQKKAQTQADNIDRQDIYQNITRAFVLAFGHDDTLKNDEPGPYYNVEYEHIPAAQDMEHLGEGEDERRDAVIAGFVEVSYPSHGTISKCSQTISPLKISTSASAIKRARTEDRRYST